MKISDGIWIVVGGVIFVAIVTRTNIIGSIMGKIKSGYGYYDPIMIPGPIAPPPVAHPLVKETHPSVIHDQYTPPGHEDETEEDSTDKKKSSSTRPKKDHKKSRHHHVTQEDLEKQAGPVPPSVIPSLDIPIPAPPIPPEQEPMMDPAQYYYDPYRSGGTPQGVDPQFSMPQPPPPPIPLQPNARLPGTNTVHPSTPQQNLTGRLTTPQPTPATTVPSGPGKTIYPAVKHYPLAPPYTIAGRNEGPYHYASNHKPFYSHRINFERVDSPNLEATVYLAWPSKCGGGGHPELAIKFYGPSHEDAHCCYCFTSAIPDYDKSTMKLGNVLHLGFGGEGPHPKTETNQHMTMDIPLVPGRLIGIKGIIWHTPTGAHQETWYDIGRGWQKAGEWDRATCGTYRTKGHQASPAVPVPNAEVELRIDCTNVTFSGTDLAAIRPPTSVGYGYYYS